MKNMLPGQCGMEIMYGAILLLLTVPLSAATPLRPPHRATADVVLPGDSLRASGLEKTEDTQEQHAQSPKIIPFHSEDKHPNLETLRHSMAVRRRQRRAAQRGCQLGTCQLHNLANTLYHIRKKNGTDESKNVKDPHGFGR
uniref:Adrenomedullin n=2 Tax=Gasterosteus aculeatus aculeatus TaxID=481459 RepID=A0AAQ4QAY7_GASAC